MTPSTTRQTTRVAVDAARPDPLTMTRAAKVLQDGGLVAFPTETVYGLGADASSPQAVARIYAAKGRPADNPLIVHVADMAMVERVVQEIPPLARRLMARFWPGPLTLVLPRSPDLPDAAAAGLDTVAVRMPQHPVARALIRAADRPIAAPSANRSGRPSPTDADHVQSDLEGRIEMILDAGPCPVGVESTVVQVLGEDAHLLRPGTVTEEMLAEVVPGLTRHAETEGLERDHAPPRSPGLRHRHYAPRARVRLFEGGDRVEALRSAAAQEREQGRKVGILATRESGLSGDQVVQVAARAEPEAYAHALYRALRAMDKEGVDVILVEGIEPVGLGAAVMDRLRRAAAG